MSDQESLFGPVHKWGRVEFPLPEYRAVEHGRDELAKLLFDALNASDLRQSLAANNLRAVVIEGVVDMLVIADAILADGWRKP
jgi:hypothetical protein